MHLASSLSAGVARAVANALLLIGLILLTSCQPARAPSSDQSAPRVISLAPSLTEIIYAIGAGTQLVGRTSACDYPPDQVKAIPIVGGFGAPTLDALLRLQPTLVLEVDLEDKALRDMFAQIGLRHQQIACAKLDDIPRAIRQVGDLTHTPTKAQALAETIQRGLAELRRTRTERQLAGQTAPTVFVRIWNDPLTTVGQGSFVADLIDLAGGCNIGNSITARDYFTVAPEWVLKQNPDIIICLDMAQVERENHESAWGLSKQMGWAASQAVKNQRVYGGLDNNAILRPGPRVLEGIAALRQCIEDDIRPSGQSPFKPGPLGAGAARRDTKKCCFYKPAALN